MRTNKNDLWALLVKVALLPAIGCGAYSESEPVDSTMLDVANGGTGGVIVGVGGTGGATERAFFSQGATYSGTTDATIALSTPTTNYGTLGTCTVDGGASERSCAIRWSLAGIPTTATILDATVRLRVSQSSTRTFSVYKLNRRWSESGVTWNKWTSVSSWGAPGAKASTDRDPVPLASFSGAAGNQAFSIPPAVVQAWLADSNANAGLLIANDVFTDGIILESSESADADARPTLSVTYFNSP